MRLNKLCSLFMVTALVCTSIFDVTAVKAASNNNIASPRIAEDGMVTYDKVTFGNYYQTVTFDESEKIKWRVLSVDETSGDVLLLADQNLDCKQYHSEASDITWENCSLRKWLNEDFINEAFTKEEQVDVRTTMVENTNKDGYYDDDDEYCIDGGGGDTYDKLYLLSVEDVCNPAYGFISRSNYATNTRYAKNTDYAKVQGAYTSAGNGYWWLRSRGDYRDDAAAFVYPDGKSKSSGTYVTKAYGVRPVLRLNLSSTFYTDAGAVTSEGEELAGDGKQLSNPIVDENGVTVWDCIYFGSYKQSSKNQKRPIEWRVLSVDEKKQDIFLVAEQILDCQPYHADDETINWEISSLRRWLNEDFINEVFTQEEQKDILITDVKDTDNNKTRDKVYLLSIDEACKAAYGFDSIFVDGSDTRYATTTDYAKVQGAYTRSGNGYWWLRSLGNDGSRSVACVDFEGWVDKAGNDADISSYGGVRPALHLNLSSTRWQYVGTSEVRSSISDFDDTTEKEDSSETTQNPTTEATDTNQAQNQNVTSLKTQTIEVAKIKTYKEKNLKVKKVTFNLKAKASGKGKLSYKVTKYPKNAKKYITVSKKGQVTLKKNAKKGTYQITIKAAKNGKYAAAIKVVKIKVK